MGVDGIPSLQLDEVDAFGVVLEVNSAPINSFLNVFVLFKLCTQNDIRR